MQSNRDVQDSKPRGASRLAMLILGATVLLGFGAASPALADQDHRDFPRVQFMAKLPLPPLPFPFPFPVFHKIDRDDYRHYGDGQKSHGHDGDRYARRDRSHFQRGVRHDPNDRRNDRGHQVVDRHDRRDRGDHRERRHRN